MSRENSREVSIKIPSRNSRSMFEKEPSHSHRSNNSVELELGNPELSIHSHHSESNANQKPTKRGKKEIIDYYNDFKDEYPNLDLYMILEMFVFLLSFIFWASQSSEDKFTTDLISGAYLYYLNTILIIDFTFRLLSITIESVQRKYWNHVLHCVFPLIMWLLAGFYGFENVFGSNPIQVLNALLFTMLNSFIAIIILMKFLTLEQFKKLFKKRNQENQENENQENNMV